MRKVDNTGRIALPKELRERRGIKEGDVYDIIEQGNDIILRSVAPTYTITENQMQLLRDIYLMAKDAFIFEDDTFYALRDICRFTDNKCVECGSELYIDATNRYVCPKCNR